MNDFSEITNFIRTIAELLRDDFKRSQYQDIVLPLMVNLVLSQDQEVLSHNHIVRTVYYPCCGSGGMLTIAKERIAELNPLADVHLFGQEVNPETFAMCKSDGSRITIVMNGSPLFTGDAGGRESEIRRWILENDWLEAIITLPE